LAHVTLPDGLTLAEQPNNQPDKIMPIVVAKMCLCIMVSPSSARDRGSPA
jgi:hypothetical protein